MSATLPDVHDFLALDIAEHLLDRQRVRHDLARVVEVRLRGSDAQCTGARHVIHRIVYRRSPRHPPQVKLKLTFIEFKMSSCDVAQAELKRNVRVCFVVGCLMRLDVSTTSISILMGWRPNYQRAKPGSVSDTVEHPRQTNDKTHTLQPHTPITDPSPVEPARRSERTNTSNKE
jgi:hypothetical protein